MSTAAEKLAYTLDEAADALTVSRRTVERLIVRGELQAVKVGTRTVVPAVALARYLEERAS